MRSINIPYYQSHIERLDQMAKKNEAASCPPKKQSNTNADILCLFLWRTRKLFHEL